MVKTGDIITFDKIFSIAQVKAFSEIISAVSKFHCSYEGAANYGLEGPLVPGSFATALIGGIKDLDSDKKLIIEKSRSYTCIRPIFVDKKYTYKIIVKDMNEETGDLYLKIYIKDENNHNCLVCDYYLKYVK